MGIISQTTQAEPPWSLNHPHSVRSPACTKASSRWRTCNGVGPLSWFPRPLKLQKPRGLGRWPLTTKRVIDKDVAGPRLAAALWNAQNEIRSELWTSPLVDQTGREEGMTNHKSLW